MKDERVMDDEEVGMLNRKLKKIAGIKYWDTAVYASVDFIFSKIEKCCAGDAAAKSLVEKCFNECL